MKYESIDSLLEESHNDLISIANSEFNLGVSKNFTKKQIAQLIMNAQKSGRYDSSVVDVMRGDEKPEDAELPKGYCILRLNRDRYNPSGYPIPVGLQGKISILPVGKNFKAPEWVIEHLNNALRQEIRKDFDQNEEESVWTHAYPFTVVKHNPSDRWHKIEARLERNIGSLGGRGLFE